jgi:hypothetical protein
MGIVFFCQSCGARFEVSPKMAGKQGRCKKCGQQMTVPRAEQLASMSAMPALVMAGAGAGAGAGAAVGGASIGSWLKEGAVSQAVLAPLTLDRKPVPRQFLPSALDDGADSKPYLLAQPDRVYRGRVKSQDSTLLRIWRGQLGKLQKLFRTINQAAYLASLPFLMILIFGAAVKNRPLAIFGATFLVLINIARLVAGCANLAVIPFRDGINVNKMKKPLRRVIEPAVTIGLVIVAFTFMPWLATDGATKGGIAGRIRASAEDLKKEMKGEVNKVVDVDKISDIAQEKLKVLQDKAKDLDLNKLGAQAQEKLNGLGSSPANSPDRKP